MSHPPPILKYGVKVTSHFSVRTVESTDKSHPTILKYGVKETSHFSVRTVESTDKSHPPILKNGVISNLTLQCEGNG